MRLLAALPAVLFPAVLLAAEPAVGAAGRAVKFPALDAGGGSVTLKGEMTRPDGAGPFPAVILLHGCSGLRGWGAMWATRLNEWGYVALRPDSFGSRGIRNCGEGDATIDVRAADARAALRYLAGLPNIDSTRMGLMGMSHGGTAALIAAAGGRGAEGQSPGFKAAVSLYPRCYQADAEALLTPVMILIGDADHLAPAGTCSTLNTRGSNGYPVNVTVYPGATHGFDWEGLEMTYFGQRIRYDAPAAADAVPRIRSFLEQHLGGK